MYIIIRTESYIRDSETCFTYLLHIYRHRTLQFICVDIIILIRGANKLILTV